MAKKLDEVSSILKCTSDEARAYGVAVQKFLDPMPSFEVITEALKAYCATHAAPPTQAVTLAQFILQRSAGLATASCSKGSWHRYQLERSRDRLSTICKQVHTFIDGWLEHEIIVRYVREWYRHRDMTDLPTAIEIALLISDGEPTLPLRAKAALASLLCLDEAAINELWHDLGSCVGTRSEAANLIRRLLARYPDGVPPGVTKAEITCLARARPTSNLQQRTAHDRLLEIVAQTLTGGKQGDRVEAERAIQRMRQEDGRIAKLTESQLLRAVEKAVERYYRVTTETVLRMASPMLPEDERAYAEPKILYTPMGGQPKRW